MVNYSNNNCNLSIFTSSTIKDAVFPKYSIYIAPCRLFEGGGTRQHSSRYFRLFRWSRVKTKLTTYQYTVNSRLEDTPLITDTPILRTAAKAPPKIPYRYFTEINSRYRVFSLTWPVSVQIYWNKRKRVHKKRVQLPQNWFGTPTWPPFLCFGMMAAVTSCENTLLRTLCPL